MYLMLSQFADMLMFFRVEASAWIFLWLDAMENYEPYSARTRRRRVKAYVDSLFLSSEKSYSPGSSASSRTVSPKGPDSQTNDDTHLDPSKLFCITCYRTNYPGF